MFSKQAMPMTDIHALKAIELIGANIVKAVTSPGNLSAREGMLMGQLHAGFAFSNSSVALVHSMSRPLGANFGVPHGQANAMLLPVVMEYNRISCPEKFVDVARALGERVEGLSVHEASVRAVTAIARLFEETALPATLATFGITEEHLPALAKDALASGSTLHNPRTPSLDDITGLYRAVLGG